MKDLLRSRTLWWSMLAWLGFIPLAVFLDRDSLFDLMYGLATAIGIGVLISYLPGIVVAIKAPQPSGAMLLVLGIACSWSATAGRTIWSWVYRFLDKPAGMIDHWSLAFLVWVIFWGGVLHMSAKDAIDGQIPRRSWIKVGAIVAIAIATMVVLGVLYDNRAAIGDLQRLPERSTYIK